MEKLGTVISVKNNVAEILIKRDSACGENCAACGLCENRELKVVIMVPQGIEKGDTVRLVSEDKEVVGFSALGYLSLTILLIAGGVLGTLLGSEWLGFALGLLFVFGGVFVLRKLSPKGAQITVEKI